MRRSESLAADHLPPMMLRYVKQAIYVLIPSLAEKARREAQLESELKRAKKRVKAKSARIGKLRDSERELRKSHSELRLSRKQALKTWKQEQKTRKQEQENSKALRNDMAKLRDHIRDLLGRSPVDLTAEQQVSLLYWLQNSGTLDERDLHALFNHLFAQREIELVQPVIADDALGFDLVRDFYRLRLLDYKSDESASPEAVAELLHKAGDSFLRGRLLTLFLQKAIAAGATESIESALSQIDDREIQSISRGTIMGLSRLFLKDERNEAVAHLLSRYIHDDRPDELLYFLDPLMELNKAGALPERFRDFCNRFDLISGPAVLDFLRTTYQGADEEDSRNFQRFIVGPLLALPQNNRNLMDVRFSSDQREMLLQEIRTSIAQEKPLSLIRLGDGESYPYSVPDVEGIRPAVFENDDRSHERHWWGAVPPEPTRENIKAGVRQAVARCDIIGLPSVYRIIRDLPSPHQRYGKNRSQRAMIKILGAVGQAIPIEGKVLTEERCHRCAIDAPFLTELAAMSRSVVVVSCWSDLHRQFLATSVESIVIPAQYNLKSRASGDDDVPPLVEVYPEIVERVRRASGPGTLVLVGAGIIGKILVDEARQRGAVALDVGSLLDYMMGVRTRAVGDML